MIKKILKKRNRQGLRARRVRATISGKSPRLRLAVYRSLKHVSAQLIDDRVGRTVAYAHDKEVDKKLKGAERAAAVGQLIGERALKQGVKEVRSLLIQAAWTVIRMKYTDERILRLKKKYFKTAGLSKI